MASPDRSSHILLPPPLRSAMKSRPNTPNNQGSSSSPSPLFSPPISALPLSPAVATTSRESASSVSYTTPSSPYSSTHPSTSAVMVASPNMSSVPLVAAQGYTHKVSFDTLENPQASMFSYTLHVQSEGYARTRSTRIFLCASSPDESGTQALEWCLDGLVQDGDELVVFRGIDSDDFADKDHDLYRDDARELMRSIQEKCVEYDPDRKLSIIV
ncbi:uncharacterized protein BXZ73DRAFT_85811, partial [Epithele typhae]|uniref:uncharacterized protein n=1 Tax=Epithele typhae TaxID=378194 RepID=UPI0020083EF8